VNLANGPDGALYVVDMYRCVIEHPDFVPMELKNRPDLMLGNDRGRIYRIAPQGSSHRVLRNLATANNAQLVEVIGSENCWQVETASRLLVELNAVDVVPQLRALAQDADRQDKISGCIGSLWTLQRLGALRSDDLLKHLQTDVLLEVAEVATRLSEPFLADNKEFQTLLVGKASNSPIQAALSLTAIPPDERAARELASAAMGNPKDPWLHAAAVICIRDQSPTLLRALARKLKAGQVNLGPPTELIQTLAELNVANHPAMELEPLVRAFTELDGTLFATQSQLAFLRGYGKGVQRRGAAWEEELSKLPDGADALREQIQHWALAAAKIAKDTKQPLEERVSAIQTLRWSNAKFAPKILLPFVTGDGDTALTLAACDALAALPGDEVAPALLERFPGAVPAVRRAILDVLLAQPSRAKLLLDAVEAGDIQPPEIDPQRTNRLLNHRDAALRERAKQLLSAGSADRAAVLAQYEPAIANLGDAQRGKAVFAKHCVTCHRIAGMGVNVGADIGDTRDKTPAYLLTAILDPNRAVDNNYFGYAVATKDGKTLTGLIAAETSTSITLKQAEGKTETILRSDIEELRATGQSFMPVGFEKNISIEEMADLVSFLKNWRYLDGAVPVGR
jgi:putative heme-binding domain-containing protein